MAKTITPAQRSTKRAFSFVETLVVIGMFAIISVIVSRATAVTLVGSRKSDASSLVRENLSFAVSVIERHLRSAREITSSCTGATASSINYLDQNGNPASFLCNPDVACSSTTNTYVASGSALSRLTNPDKICITSCQFVCTSPAAGMPPTIRISIEGKSKEASGVEDTSVRLETGVSLRAY